MKLRLIDGDGGCGGEACPSIYETDRGTYVVKGWRISDSIKKNISLTTGEDAIEIPTDIIESIIKK